MLTAMWLPAAGVENFVREIQALAPSKVPASLTQIMDSFDSMFCRRCRIYNCLSHKKEQVKCVARRVQYIVHVYHPSCATKPGTMPIEVLVTGRLVLHWQTPHLVGPLKLCTDVSIFLADPSRGQRPCSLMEPSQHAASLAGG